MADNHKHEVGKSDNTAKTFATIALVLAVIALGWAIKADNHAGEAESKAVQASQVGQ